MLTIFEQLQSKLTDMDFMLTWLVSLVFLLLSIINMLPTLKSKWADAQNQRTIKNLGSSIMSDVVIANSLDEPVYIDHLILTAKGIVVLIVMKYRGIIFASNSMQFWTQLIGQRSFKFPNPLRDLEVNLAAIQGMVSQCNVIGHIAFIAGCEFPKGKPEQVSILDETSKSLDINSSEVPEHIQQCWKDLQNSVQHGEKHSSKDLGLSLITDNKNKRLNLSWLYLSIAMVWLLYRLFGSMSLSF
ncbi:MAG: hypothetical protein BMS9Abin31_0259 [Gammaproteobacteria bacterium]|nr:MAG: hypothetical protein BMS9Abin31_0259 [Gammaproteobacteria bacterium]